jgi:SAM-dependent methyltransferase
MHVSHCRSCGAEIRDTMVDLGEQPLANSYLTRADLGAAEARYPLRAMVCGTCFLVQLDEVVDATRIFSSDYAYFASYSDSWLAHARGYAEHLIERFELGAASLAVEIASNDGYLLRNFVERGIPALGIEPAANVARAARAIGVPTRVGFFSAAAASHLLADGCAADVIIANNVLAHVPELNDFVRGVARLLKPDGVATIECPHLMRLMDGCQFDTIYHEHYSYFSLASVERVCARHGLRIFDVQEWPTHGGSMRIFLQHVAGPHRVAPEVGALKAQERAQGLEDLETYRLFGARIATIRDGLLTFLTDARRRGARVAGYGAPAKGNTLLNYCGITADLLPFTVDRNPNKQGRFLPGSRIPVHDPSMLREVRPDYLLLLPWNLREEIAAQLSWIGEWDGRFVTPVPRVTEWRADGAAAA